MLAVPGLVLSKHGADSDDPSERQSRVDSEHSQITQRENENRWQRASRMTGLAGMGTNPRVSFARLSTALAHTRFVTDVISDEEAQEVLQIELNTQMEDEAFLPPAVNVVAAKERKRVRECLDLVNKGFISPCDVHHLLPRGCDPKLVGAFMDAFRKRGEGERGPDRVQYDEFWKVIEQLSDTVPNFSPAERVHQLLSDSSSCRLAKYVSMFVILLIVLSSLNFVVETMPYFNDSEYDREGRPDPPAPRRAFWYIECACIVCFTIEYLGRLLTVAFMRPREHFRITVSVLNGCRLMVEASGSCANRLVLQQIIFKPPILLRIGNDMEGETMKLTKVRMQRVKDFVLQAMNVVDAVAILPFWLELIAGAGSGGLGFLRVLRLARVFRVFKMGKYNQGMQLFGSVIARSLPAMYILGFFGVLGMVLFGSLIYFAEQGTWTVADHLGDGHVYGEFLRPDLLGPKGGKEISPFYSIPACFWWVLVTASTVGYGDLYPTSELGKFVGALCALCGVLVLALPITIIGAEFANEYAEVEERKTAKTTELIDREKRETYWNDKDYARLTHMGLMTQEDLLPDGASIETIADGIIQDEFTLPGTASEGHVSAFGSKLGLTPELEPDPFPPFNSPYSQAEGSKSENKTSAPAAGSSKGTLARGSANPTKLDDKLKRGLVSRWGTTITKLVEHPALSNATQVTMKRELGALIQTVDTEAVIPWGGRLECTMSMLMALIALEPPTAEVAGVRRGLLELFADMAR